MKKRLGLDPAEWRHFQLTVPKDDIGIDADVCSIIAVSHYVKVSPAAVLSAVSPGLRPDAEVIVGRYSQRWVTPADSHRAE